MNMTPELSNLYARVGDLVKSAGIDNFHFENNILLMCGVRYAVESCECDDPECCGLTLRRTSDGPGGLAAAQ